MRFSLKRAAAVGVASLAITFLGAGAAFAGTHGGTATGHTYAAHHPDTTSVSGTGTQSSDNGPVWAYDNLSFTLHSLRTGPDTYAVEVDAHGTFDGFANPNTGNADHNYGRVNGWLDMTVTSPDAPRSAYLPRQEPGSVSQTSIVEQFFGGEATNVVGGHYDYKYRNIDGHLYEQVG